MEIEDNVHEETLRVLTDDCTKPKSIQIDLIHLSYNGIIDHLRRFLPMSICNSLVKLVFCVFE